MQHCPPKPMTDALLLKKLAVVITIKLVAITALWWLFVRDERVTVEPASVAEHIGRSATDYPTHPDTSKNQGKTDGH